MCAKMRFPVYGVELSPNEFYARTRDHSVFAPSQ